MLTKDEILEILRKNYFHLKTEYGVKRIGLFGSYAKGLATETSDVDVVVEFERPPGFKFIEFTEYLEFILNRKVDVLTLAGIQGIRIHSVAKSIAESIVYV